MELCFANGKTLDTAGHMSTGFGSEMNVTISLENLPQAGMIAKVYLLTDKSVIRVPVKLPAVPLPWEPALEEAEEVENPDSFKGRNPESEIALLEKPSSLKPSAARNSTP